MIRGNLNARKIPLTCKIPWNVIQERDSRYTVPWNDPPPLRYFTGSKRTTGKTEGEKGWKILFVTPAEPLDSFHGKLTSGLKILDVRCFPEKIIRFEKQVQIFLNCFYRRILFIHFHQKIILYIYIKEKFRKRKCKFVEGKLKSLSS